MNRYDEPYTGIPLGIELSGLPQLVLEKTKSAAGWAVLRKVIEMDCAQHPSRPAYIEISVKELAERAAVTPEQLRKVITPLRKLHAIKCFLPDNDEDTALFEISIPLQVPIERDEIIQNVEKASGKIPAKLRYIDNLEPNPQEDADMDKTTEKDLQEIVDTYLNTIGTKINVFIVDELRLMQNRYPMPAIRKAFDRARKNEVRSLAWIASCLAQTRRNKTKTKTDYQDHTEDCENEES